MGEGGDLVLGESLECVVVAFEQQGAGVGEFFDCLGGERDEAAAAVVGVGGAVDEAVALHADEELRHGRLLDLGEPGEFFLGERVAVLQGAEHRKLSDGETESVEPGLSAADEQTGGTVDEVAGLQEDFRVHFYCILWVRIASYVIR